MKTRRENKNITGSTRTTGRIIAISLVMTLTMISGCVDNNEDPPIAKQFEYGTIVPISQVKALYNTELAKVWYDRTPVEITEDWAIAGIVTGSDKVDGNLYKEGYVEDASSGIRLIFESTGGFYLGDSVVVNLKGLYIGDYGDFVQVGGIPYTDASGNIRVSGFNKDDRILRVSVNNPFDPPHVTIQNINSGNYLGRLVTLDDVEFADYDVGRTYADVSSDPPASMNRDLEDCDGNSIIVRSSGYATFAGDPLPQGKGSFTGIVTYFNPDYQLLIRDISEVVLNNDRCAQGGQTLGDPVETLSQDFETFATDEDIFIDGWQNLMVVGTRIWRAKVYSGNAYAQATGYLSGLTEMESWLISPPVILSTAKVLTFRSAIAYWAHTGGNKPLEVMISTDYNGSDVHSATWTPLAATLAGQSDANYAWVESGSVNLPVIAGQSGVIAFKYTGNDTESTTAIIDDIVVSNAK